MASTNYINECKNRANGNRLGNINVEGLETPITQSDRLQNFSIDSGCFVDGNIIGSVYIKKLTGQILDSNELDLINKKINAQIGVKFADNTTEYINMGNYTVQRPKDEQTENISQIIAYDKLNDNLENKYLSNIDYSQENITLKDIYTDVCNQLELIPTNLDFTNNDIPIRNNPFTNGETNRIVLQAIAKISSSWVEIDNDSEEIDLKWLSQSTEPDYIFHLNDYATLEGGKIISGPINCLIIKNSQVDDENVTITDDESIAINGEHSIVISEDYILYNAELRNQAISAIWEKVRGMTYVDCKLITYYGKPFLKLGNKIRIYINENDYFDTYVLKHNFTFDGTFYSVIESPALTKQEIKTKQNVTLGELLKNTQLQVKKQEQEIQGVVTKVDENSEQITTTTQKVNGFEIDVKNVQTSIDTVVGEVNTMAGKITDMSFNFTTKGLAIGTSQDSNNSLLDNTGIKVYNYNTLNAIFNNKGSGIDKLIVTGTAQIGYLRFIKSTKNGKPVTKIFHLNQVIEDLHDLEV